MIYINAFFNKASKVDIYTIVTLSDMYNVAAFFKKLSRENQEKIIDFLNERTKEWFLKLTEEEEESISDSINYFNSFLKNSFQENKKKVLLDIKNSYEEYLKDVESLEDVDKLNDLYKLKFGDDILENLKNIL